MAKKVAVLCGVLALATASPAIAEIVARFSDGNDETSGGTSAPTVDSYRGAAGGGWGGPWRTNTNFGPVFTAGVDAAAPVNGGGNYLAVSLSQQSGNFGQAAVNRQYTDPTNSGQLSQTHTISFDFRTDVALATELEGATFNDRYQIFDHVNGNESATLMANTWTIAAYGAPSASAPGGIEPGNWGFLHRGAGSTGAFNTLTFVDSGIKVTAGATYHMEVTTNPTTKTWSAVISDGTTTYNSLTSFGPLGWRNQDATEAGGHLYWGMQKNRLTPSDEYRFSLDNISISIDVGGLDGDFDRDGAVDGRDFLIWQRGESPDPLSATDFDKWQANFGASPAVAGVPEPGAVVLAVTAGLAATRWSRNSRQRTHGARRRA